MPVYPKIFAAVYNPILASGEVAGMRKMRQSLLADVKGSVLEIGAGTGLNLKHYPPGVELTVTEPDAAMAAKLEKAVGRSGLNPTVVQAPAEKLPFPDDSFDACVSTMVLCTVADVPAALAEIRRVVRTGGRLLLVEHVRSDGPKLGRVQDRAHSPWKAFACGCNCNLDTVSLLKAAGFDTAPLREAKWKLMPPLVRPLVVGALAMS
ncbi:MAG: class I SAM-dependent methyltransferase [Sporichthyaceae bacterium]